MFNEFNNLLVIVALACASTLMVNKTNEPWNAFDLSQLARAKVRCGELYPDFPCVKMFRKFQPKFYTALCGRSQ